METCHLNPARFLIFDFDGTLVDTAPDIAFHVSVVLEKRGHGARTLEQVRQGIGWGVHELIKTLTPETAWEPKALDDAVAEFKRLYGERPVIRTQPYAGVRETLAGPLAHVPKAILTNKPHTLTVSILEELDLAGHFEDVLGEGVGFPRKPDPTGAYRLMKSAGIPARETILIGDSHIDQETARNAQMGFAWMDYGYDDRLRDDPSVLRLSKAEQWSRLCAGR